MYVHKIYNLTPIYSIESIFFQNQEESSLIPEKKLLRTILAQQKIESHQ